MMRKHNGRRGYTLVEISVAALILIIAVSMAMRGFLYVLRGTRHNISQNELDIDVQTAMERIKRDLRLSSMDRLSFAPASAKEYTAISFPMARDDDGDGAVDMDENNDIIWDRQLVYHVWASTPNQLRLTVFDPRDNSLTPDERQAQAEHVLKYGSGDGTHNGNNAATLTVFENLFNWSLKPSGAEYDAYAEEKSRDINVPLGTAVLDSGNHTITFELTGKNAKSSSYKFGIDTITMSPSYGEREAEAQLPASAIAGPTPSAVYMSNGSWSGNYHLYFPSYAKGHSFTLTLANDRWEETNFGRTGFVNEDTEIEFKENLSPKDFVVGLDGMKTNWWANLLTGDETGHTPAYDALRSTAIRVVLPGRETGETGTLSGNGKNCRVTFKSGDYPNQGLLIQYAYIAEAATSTNLTMDTIAGTEKLLKFGGSTWGYVTPGKSIQSDWVNLTIDEERSYIVSYLLTAHGGWSNPWQWDMAYTNASEACFVVPASSTPGLATLTSPTWSTRGDVIKTNAVFGVESLMVSFPEKGFYTSGIYDTHIDSPSYDKVGWSSWIPSGCGLSMRVRTASSNDMSDAVAWTNITAMSSAGSLSVGSGRYVQFQAEMTSSSDGLLSPLLKDVVISWPGEAATVDIACTFTQGPDYGIAKVLVDGRPLQSAVLIDLEIFANILAYGYPQRITSQLSAEVMPLNTGK